MKFENDIRMLVSLRECRKDISRAPGTRFRSDKLYYDDTGSEQGLSVYSKHEDEEEEKYEVQRYSPNSHAKAEKVLKLWKKPEKEQVPETRARRLWGNVRNNVFTKTPSPGKHAPLINVQNYMYCTFTCMYMYMYITYSTRFVSF